MNTTTPPPRNLTEEEQARDSAEVLLERIAKIATPPPPTGETLTPRTDKQIATHRGAWQVCPADFARILERELNEANRQLAAVKAPEGLREAGLTAGERAHLHGILDAAILNAGGPLFRGRVKAIKEKLSNV